MDALIKSLRPGKPTDLKSSDAKPSELKPSDLKAPEARPAELDPAEFLAAAVRAVAQYLSFRTQQVRGQFVEKAILQTIRAGSHTAALSSRCLIL